MQIILPEPVAQAMAQLQEKGIAAWVIGGAVRDSLLGRPVHDWDLTVDCTPERLAAALPDAKPIGGEYGTVAWRGVEITPCRTEADYSDRRHPDQVSFGGGLRGDLSRRDFTVNAMAWDGQVVTDPYHGRYDLANGVLRCVGDPAVRFNEDALRILRLYRFAGTLGFAVEPETGREALRLAATLDCVSAQRVRAELEKALAGGRPSALWPLIQAGGLAGFGIGMTPEQAEKIAFFAQEEAAARQPPAGPEKENPLLALDAVPAVPLLRWWALLRLTCSNPYRAAKIFDFGKGFQRDYARLSALFAEGMPADRHALKLWLMRGLPLGAADVAAAFAAVEPGFAGLPALYRQLEESGEPYRKEQLRITAAELLTEGVPARKIGAVQKCLLKAVIDSPELNVWPTLAQMARALAKLM